MHMYPSTPVTFVMRERASTFGPPHHVYSVYQYPRLTRRDGAIGSPMGTSAIVGMVASRRAFIPYPLALSQPNLSLNGMIEGF